MSKAFKDLGKESKDLLSQDFISGNSLVFTGKTKTLNNIDIKGSVKRNFKTDAKTKVTKENVEILIEPKYEWKNQDVEISAKLSTSRDYSLGFVSKDLFTKGTKIDFLGTLNEKDGLTLKFTPSYKSDSFSNQLSCSYPILSHNKKTSQPLKWAIEGVFKLFEKIHLGINFLIDKDYSHSKKRIEGTAIHAKQNNVVAARVSYDHHEELFVWGFSYFQELPHNKAKLAADYEVDAKGPTAKIGGEYKVDDRTTLKGLAVVKSEAGAPTDYRLGLSFKQNVSPHLKATLCADVNVRHILGEGAGQAHSFGCEFEISG